MKLSLHVVGRMKNGPERELFARYFDRALASGKQQGIHPVTVKEYSESKAQRGPDRKRQEGDEILSHIDASSFVIALDERGKTLSSPDFADLIGRARDDGVNEVVFVIGGADGLDDAVRKRAQRTIAFGAMTWPHQIVRVLAVEQIYRAISIMGNHPYHKI